MPDTAPFHILKLFLNAFWLLNVHDQPLGLISGSPGGHECISAKAPAAGTCGRDNQHSLGWVAYLPPPPRLFASLPSPKRPHAL